MKFKTETSRNTSLNVVVANARYNRTCAYLSLLYEWFEAEQAA